MSKISYLSPLEPPLEPLSEALCARRGLDPRAFNRRAVTDTPARTLAVVSCAQRSWHFPWSCLVCFEYDAGGTTEILRLFFGVHAVLIEGTRLALLLPEISELRLQSIHEVPPGAEHTVAENAPLIRKVTVRQRGERGAGQPPRSVSF